MDALTHPQAYYEFFDKYHHQSRRYGEIAGVAAVAIGLVTVLVPPLRNLLAAAVGAGAVMTSCLLLILAGGGMALSLLLVEPKYKSITLFPNGIAIAGRDGKRQVHFSQIYAVMEYKARGRRWTKLHIYGQPKQIWWNDRHLRDYYCCIAQMEKLRADYLLGGEFPETINSLELALSDKLRLSGGKLYYEGAAIEPISYRADTFDRLAAGSADIALDLPDGRVITLTPERTGNRAVLLRVLEFLSAQNAAMAVAAVPGTDFPPAGDPGDSETDGVQEES